MNNAERLAQDPTFRLTGPEKIWELGAAKTSRLRSFETEVLSQEENLTGLAVINRELIAKAEGLGFSQSVVLEMDSTEIPVYGQPENSAYKGHFESICYHPLLLFNREGGLIGEVAAARQRAQRPRLGTDAAAGDRRAVEGWQGRRFPRGRCSRQAGDLRSPGSAGREVHHPHPGQRQPGAGHC